LIRILSFRYLP